MVAVVIHGGAGKVWPGDRRDLCIAGCRSAARAAHAVLREGGAAVDAVQRAVEILEDEPCFNAGLGSTLNEDGEIEMDALLMEGAELRAGGVAALRAFRHPIAIARAVMQHSPHVLLAAEGAARFARRAGFTPCPPAELVTPEALERWHREREDGWSRRPGTVGAVAVDARGTVAAATSTGGISGKYAGRIGDSPLIGCGTYADNATGAASATGAGEAIMRLVLTKTACDRLSAGQSAVEAATHAVGLLDRLGAEGGIIVVSSRGDIAAVSNTERMSRAWIDAEGREMVAFER